MFAWLEPQVTSKGEQQKSGGKAHPNLSKEDLEPLPKAIKPEKEESKIS